MAQHSSGLIATRRGTARHPITGKRIAGATILGATILGYGSMTAAAFASPTKDDNAPLTQADWIELPEPDGVTYDDTEFDPATMTPSREGDQLAEYATWVAAGKPGYIADAGGSKGVEVTPTPEGVNSGAGNEGAPLPASTHNWSGVAECESGNDWDYYKEGHLYSGGLQFLPSTWDAYGGREFAEFAHLATEAEQIIVADRVAFTGYGDLAPQGIGAWPTCGRYLEQGSDATVSIPATGDVTVRSLTNAARAAAGCDPLDVNWNLVASAKRHADWMASTGIYNQHSQLGNGVVAENIAHGQQSAQAVTDAWLSSPDHRANMLNCDYTHMGLGWNDGAWVQQFGIGAVAPTPAPVANSTGQAAVDVAMNYLGWPYIWGGESPNEGGFDCSGIVQWAYAQVGVTHIGRTTWDHMIAGWSVPLDQLQPGDVIITSGTEHEVLYIGNGQVLQAQQVGTNLMITPLADILNWYGPIDARRFV